jgi:methyl-accepting chemotaxis protein
MSEENTQTDNGEPAVEVTFETLLAEMQTISDAVELAGDAIGEIEEAAEEVQIVVRSAPLKLMLRRLGEVRTMLDTLGESISEAVASVECLDSHYADDDDEEAES